MGITRDIYGNGSLTDWQTWTVTMLNCVTFLITAINVIYLIKNMPKAHHPEIQNNPQLQHITSVPVLRRQKSIHSVLLSKWRTAVIRYFYIIAILPMLLAYPAHYGAQYPQQSIWIFPALDCVVTIAFLTFMRMIVLSCDGMDVIRFYLESTEDHCKLNCCKKQNAWIGFNARLKWCYLIVAKPLVDYTFSYLEYYYGTRNFQNELRITLKILIMCLTFVPVNGLKMFHKSLYKYSRMKRTKSKTYFIVCLAPGVQIQQMLVSLLFNADAINDQFVNVDTKFRWGCLYGMLLCFEMVIFAAFVTFVFHPKDLMLWDDTDILLAEHNENVNNIKSNTMITPNDTTNNTTNNTTVNTPIALEQSHDLN